MENTNQTELEAIVVYSTPSCPACRMTCARLDKAKVKYQTVDLSTDPDAMEKVKGMGYSSAPVVTAAGRSWYGFRPDLIDEVLPQYQA